VLSRPFSRILFSGEGAVTGSIDHGNRIVADGNAVDLAARRPGADAARGNSRALSPRNKKVPGSAVVRPGAARSTSCIC